MIAQWKDVGDIYWRLDLPGGLYALVYPCSRGTYRVRGSFAPLDGARDPAEGKRWAVESLRVVVRDALDQLEDLAPEMVIAGERESAIVITEG